MVEICPTIPAEEFLTLYNMLNQIRLRKTNRNDNRRGFPFHEKMTLGMVRRRIPCVIGLSNDSILYPDLFEEVMRIGDKYCPFEYTSIHVNHNVVCPPHVDDKNNGVSMLVSFGEYEGCKIVIAGDTYDAKHTPILFDGSKLLHWNTDDLVGNKYSLMYYRKTKW
jgi:hypothetical protein